MSRRDLIRLLQIAGGACFSLGLYTITTGEWLFGLLILLGLPAGLYARRILGRVPPRRNSAQLDA